MQKTYQIANRGTVVFDDALIVRGLLKKLTWLYPDLLPENLNIMTVYDRDRTYLVTDPDRTLAQEQLSCKNLFVCYYVPGILILPEGTQNHQLHFSNAYPSISDPIMLTLFFGNRFHYPVVSANCSLGTLLNLLKQWKLLDPDVSTATVHDCFNFNSIPRSPMDITPGASVLNRRLCDLDLFQGPPIYLKLK